MAKGSQLTRCKVKSTRLLKVSLHNPPGTRVRRTRTFPTIADRCRAPFPPFLPSWHSGAPAENAWPWRGVFSPRSRSRLINFALSIRWQTAALTSCGSFASRRTWTCSLHVIHSDINLSSRSARLLLRICEHSTGSRASVAWKVICIGNQRVWRGCDSWARYQNSLCRMDFAAFTFENLYLPAKRAKYECAE